MDMNKLLIGTLAGGLAFFEPVVTAARMAIAGSVVGWTLGKMTG